MYEMLRKPIFNNFFLRRGIKFLRLNSKMCGTKTKDPEATPRKGDF